MLVHRQQSCICRDRRKDTIEEKETFVLGGLILQFPFETGVRGNRAWYLSLMAVMDSVVWYGVHRMPPHEMLFFIFSCACRSLPPPSLLCGFRPLLRVAAVPSPIPAGSREEGTGDVLMVG